MALGCSISRIAIIQPQAALLEAMSLLVWSNWTPSAVEFRCIPAYHPHSQVVTQEVGCPSLSSLCSNEAYTEMKPGYPVPCSTRVAQRRPNTSQDCCPTLILSRHAQLALRGLFAQFDAPCFTSIVLFHVCMTRLSLGQVGCSLCLFVCLVGVWLVVCFVGFCVLLLADDSPASSTR